MGSVNRSTICYFIVWLFIVPPGSIYVFVNFPLGEVNWFQVMIFIFCGFLTLYFPIMRNGKPVFLVMWVTVPVFLMHGLFVEIITMQISLLAFFLNSPNLSSIIRRLFLNSILFFILSITAAFFFDLVGGEVGLVDFYSVVLAVFCYQLVHKVFNDLLLKLYATYRKKTTPFNSKELLAEYAVVLIVLPLSLTFYFLLQLVGSGAFLLLGIPFFFITFVVRLYSNSEKINVYLQQAGDIGTELSGLLSEQEVIEQFVIKVSDMFDAEYAYLFDHKEGWLELVCSYEHKELIDIEFGLLSVGQGIAGFVLKKNHSVIYSKRKEWEMISKDKAPGDMQSILCVPITRNQKIEAVLLLASKKKSAFADYQLKILDLLCSYFAVSVEKVRYMEEMVTKNERCALTKLYNYRYLEKKLHYEKDRLKNNMITNLSVVMLDIDHFKKVNDNYGHQCGNDILCLFAKKIEKALPEGGTVGRYGGEEFVFILPDMVKNEAVEFAEKLRAKISKHAFTIIPDLSEDKCPLVVQITSSIGVSSIPEDTDEVMALLRNADRALYIGAKQAGRNRVAEYVK
ncbi:diguanylate cyclase [Sporosarcina limicola]|uniref:Diguanylate cyclase (GGDEF)-like protein n=1 Tax=Sporosarcina limicola TaxID=34101 RepID=A0A927REG0_9BACL|nr:diguanylate cyclase [Sporosarcina limicola]MBE1554567.1 diguanylate cyclase (GGDEF)-like protein [Sporosarcina limicola]